MSQAWKADEREFARQLQRGAGRVKHPPYTSMVSPTGRVGHITELGFDILSATPNTEPTWPPRASDGKRSWELTRSGRSIRWCRRQSSTGASRRCATR
jgi:hypothetical protein